MSEHPATRNRRVRLLYSMNDLRLAVSAADFLSECDPDARIGKDELRRYRCYETTAIISYARPFSDPCGDVPKLSMDMIGVRLDGQSQMLHDQLILLRNRVRVQSDTEMSGLAARIDDLNMGHDETMLHMTTVLDQGPSFAGFRAAGPLLTLFNTVYLGICSTLMEDAQRHPEGSGFRGDHPGPEGPKAR